ncbi:MAG: cytochrome b/b6 domain-containing protein [Cyanobacteria bacterium J06614_10]
MLKPSHTAKPSWPYQPFLLRFLHGLTALCLILAMLTAFWTYTVYDGRWVQAPLPDYRAIEGIHGTFGLYTLLIFPAFVLYAFHRGAKRLIQPGSWSTLARVGEPIWWYSLNRLTNTFALLALTFALFSGKMMDETWLPKGELNHAWYEAHVVSWVVMLGAIALHGLLNARLGGLSLLLSMWHTKVRATDSPRRWPGQIMLWWAEARQMSWLERWHAFMGLPRLALAIFGVLLLAWVLSLVKEVTDLLLVAS